MAHVFRFSRSGARLVASPVAPAFPGGMRRSRSAGPGALYAGERIPALLDHFGHRGILDLALHGDREELRLDAACRPDARHTVFLAELRFEDGGDGKEAVTAPGEFSQHGVVLELADH